MSYLGRNPAKSPLVTSDIPDNSITAAKIVEGTITVGDIGTDAVGTDEIVNDAVTADKLANSINTDIATGVAALPKAGGTMSGNIVMNDDTSIGISDSDERIEFDGQGDICFLGCNVGIGTSAPATDRLLHLQSSAVNVPVLEIENINADDNGPSIRFSKNSASPADDERIGSIDFYGRDDGDNELNYGSIYLNATDVSDGDEDSTMFFGTREGASWKTAMTIAGSRIGVGAANAVGQTFRVTGQTQDLTEYAMVVVNGGAVSTLMFLRNDGFTYAYQAWATSDKNKKENIRYLTEESVLDKINQLKLCRFDFIGGMTDQVGFIAQDVEKIFPDLVSNEPEPNKEEITKGLNYGYLGSYLIKAVQELSAKNDSLEAENTALKTRMDALEARVLALEG